MRFAYNVDQLTTKNTHLQKELHMVNETYNKKRIKTFLLNIEQTKYILKISNIIKFFMVNIVQWCK